MQQRTIARDIVIQGQALHSGVDVEMICRPAPEGKGVTFYHNNEASVVTEIPAKVENVVETRKCTALGKGQVRILTVEHLMAAMAGLNIDNLDIYVNGPEIPHGNACFFAEKFLESGLVTQNAERRVAILKEPVYVSTHMPSGAIATIVALPAERTRFSYTFVSEHVALTDQYAEFIPEKDDFIKDIAPARTIAFLKEIEYLRQQGRALGGNMDIAVVVGEDSLVSEMRLPNEVAKHKIVDMLGDLYLAGPVQAHFIGIRSGHALDFAFSTKLVETLYRK